MSFGLRIGLAHLVAAGGDDRDAIDVRPSGLDGEFDFLLLEIAEALGDHFADLVAAGDPAELHVDGLQAGLGEATRADRERRGGGGDRCGGALEQISPCRKKPLRHRTHSIAAAAAGSAIEP